MSIWDLFSSPLQCEEPKEAEEEPKQEEEEAAEQGEEAQEEEESSGGGDDEEEEEEEEAEDVCSIHCWCISSCSEKLIMRVVASMRLPSKRVCCCLGLWLTHPNLSLL